MLSSVLLVVSLVALAVVLVAGARTVLERGLGGLLKMGPGVYAVFGVYAVTFVGFLVTQS